MSESLKARVGRVIAGGAHALIDHLEDLAPEAAMEQAIREAGRIVEDVRADLGRASANRHLAEQQLTALQQQHEELSGLAAHAVAQQRDDLARAAVARQLDVEAQLPVLTAALEDLRQQEHELRGYVEALRSKQREMQEALGQFQRSRAARPDGGDPGGVAERPIPSAQARMAQTGAAFERLFGRHTGLRSLPVNGNDQEDAKLRELEELSRRHRIDERLAQLRQPSP